MTDIYDLKTCINCGIVLDKCFIKTYKEDRGYHGEISYEFTCPLCKKKINSYGGVE